MIKKAEDADGLSAHQGRERILARFRPERLSDFNRIFVLEMPGNKNSHNRNTAMAEVSCIWDHSAHSSPHETRGSPADLLPRPRHRGTDTPRPFGGIPFPAKLLSGITLCATDVCRASTCFIGGILAPSAQVCQETNLLNIHPFKRKNLSLLP